MRPPRSIRERLLHIHLVVAFVAVMIFFAGVSVIDWKQNQQVLVVNFANSMRAAAEGAAGYMQVRDLRGLDTHLRDFQGLPGMMALCVYDEDSTAITAWQASNATEGCPQFIMREGLERDWLNATTAIPLMHNKTYLGMLYAKSRLTMWHIIILREGTALLALLMVAYLACRLSSHYGAHAITASLNALKGQIDCLKNDDYTLCTLLPPMTTLETASLARSITDFRSHLATETLPRKELKQLHHWYQHLFAGLLRALRHQLDADAPLLDTLDNYEQLLRMQAGAALPEPIIFDIAKLLRTCVLRAREEFPENQNVALSASLQSSVSHEWLGYPKILAMLLQHLLHVALSRTRQGAVCLRLGVEEVDSSERLRLTIKLEDSGPPLQRWQLDQWLNGAAESLLATETGQDISWLMVGQLLRHMGGSATAETDPRNGLLLTASLPIEPPHVNASRSVLPLPAMTTPRNIAGRPLVLVVEHMPEKRRILEDLFDLLGCRIFTVDDHAQAMIWAPVLPFSALLLNGSLADVRSMVVKRLHHLAEENLMPHIPIWLMVGAVTVAEEKYWDNEDVHTLLIQPLKRAVLEPLCNALPMPDADFYNAYDAHLQGEFPTSILTRLPELNREIGKQLHQLHDMLLALPNNSRHALVCQQAHAVKSASLTLGYFRLAALMSEIEHALASKAFDSLPQHWRIIADVLDPGLFEQQRASA